MAMSPKPTQKKWLSLPQMRVNKFSQPRVFNDEYIVIASDDHNQGIYSYHLSKDEFLNVWKYPMGVEPLRHSVIVSNDKKIYLYNNIPSATDVFYEININDTACIVYKGGVHGLPEGVGNETGGGAVLCDLNGIIHCIGGYSNGYHSIWHQSNDAIDAFKQYPIGDKKPKESLYGHSVLPLPDRNQLLLMGGNNSTVWGGYLKDIWIYNLQNNMKWIKKDVSLPNKMFYFGSIYVNNKNYGKKIIVFGGKSSSGLKDEIWILDLITWKWSKSLIKCPKKSMYYALYMEKKQDIHLFAIDSTSASNNNDNHWKIKLNQIINIHLINKNQVSSLIDKNIISSLKQQLVQDKKNIKLFNQEKEKYILQIQEYQSIINGLKIKNNKFIRQTQTLNDELNELKSNYDDVKNDLINKDKELIKINNNYKILNQKYNELLVIEKRRTFKDVSNYMKWSYSDVINWIGYLEQGRFEKYMKLLNINLKKENIKGEHLTDLDKHDIHRLGVIDYTDKKALLKHFQSLQTVNCNDN